MATVQFSCIFQSRSGRLCASREALSFASSQPLTLRWPLVRAIDVVTKKLHGALAKMIAVQHTHGSHPSPLFFHSMADVTVAHSQLFQFFAACRRELDVNNASMLSDASLGTPLDPMALSGNNGGGGQPVGLARRLRAIATPAAADASPASSSAASPANVAPAVASPPPSPSAGKAFGWAQIRQSTPLMLLTLFVAFIATVFVVSTVDLLFSTTKAIVGHVVGGSSAAAAVDAGQRDPAARPVPVEALVPSRLGSLHSQPASSSALGTSGAAPMPLLQQQHRPSAPSSPSASSAGFADTPLPRQQQQQQPPAEPLPPAWHSRLPLDATDPGMAALLAMRPAAAVQALALVDRQLSWAQGLLAVGAVGVVVVGVLTCRGSAQGA
jgi:hypothetical protein